MIIINRKVVSCSVRCPKCDAKLVDGAERCPYCKTVLKQESAGKPDQSAAGGSAAKKNNAYHNKNRKNNRNKPNRSNNKPEGAVRSGAQETNVSKKDRANSPSDTVVIPNINLTDAADGSNVKSDEKVSPKSSEAAGGETVRFEAIKPEKLSEKLSNENKGDSKIDISDKTQNSQANNETGSELYDFDMQYSLTFKNADAIREAAAEFDANKGEDKSRESSHRRSSRNRSNYRGEAFESLSDEEKLQALEAARLERKAKRERKHQGKHGVSKPSSVSGMKEADRKQGGFRSKKSGEIISGMNGKRNGENAEKPAILSERSQRARSSSRSDSSERKKTSGNAPRLSAKVGLAVGALAVCVVVAVVIASVNMFSNVVESAPETPTTYLKDNALYSYYDGEVAQLSGNFISAEYVEPEPSATPSSSRDDDSDEDSRSTPEPTIEPIEDRDLINYTADGLGTYYIDSADMNTKTGTLKYYASDGKSDVREIAQNVYYDIDISPDGAGVLYLTNVSGDGKYGELNYWSTATNASETVASDVNRDNFMFSQDGKSVLYVTRYNDEYFVGDLYVKSYGENAPIEPVMIDSDVYKAYGTNPSGSTVVYAKNYSEDDETHTVFVSNVSAPSPTQVVENSKCDPVLLTKSDNMFVAGNFENYYQTLYYASLTSGQTQVMASGFTEFVKTSADEQAVIFRSASSEGTYFEYYYASTQANTAQRISGNITVLDDPEHERVVQLDVNDDFTRCVYIEGYNPETESGALYECQISNFTLGAPVKISERAYSCDVSKDGTIVRYADDYDTTWNLVDLKMYENGNNVTVAEDVSAGAFTYDENGVATVYAKNYSIETRTGDVYVADEKGRSTEVGLGVNSYGLKQDGQIIFHDNMDNAENKFELYYAKPSGKGAKAVDDSISEILAY